MTNGERNQCEGLITNDECKIALNSMQNNKSPGSDGLTCEFYKIFWNDIGNYLVDSLNQSFETGKLNPLQTQSIISLIPKKDKDLAELNNWRPISLLNTDYKIATKVIANRIKKILPNIIDSSQTGFIKGRYIGENIRLLFDLIEQTEENDIPGLLFFTDFEKAFDSISHKYLVDTLKFFNFGPSFIKWIEVFYNDATSCISNNGYLSNFFKIKRGVRQGCPLSPYLFILGIELLSYAVKTHEGIKGLNICNEEVKDTLFADDATFTLDGSEDSFRNIIYLFDEFKKKFWSKIKSSKMYNFAHWNASKY